MSVTRVFEGTRQSGYVVQIERKGSVLRRYFGDRKWGGEKRAHGAAIDYRKTVLHHYAQHGSLPLRRTRHRDIEGEVWRPVKGYEGEYEVSDHGRVRKLHSSSTLGHRIVERTLVSRPIGNCWHVVLHDEDGSSRDQKGHYVHIMVYVAFVDPRYHKRYTRIHPIDGNYCNCTPGNWETTKERRIRILGYEPRKRDKLTIETARVIRKRLAMGEKGKILAQDYGVTPAVITRIKQGKIWKER